MLRYIAKRVLSAIITIWFIMTLTFILMNAIPGDPFASEKMNDPVIIANMKAKYAKAEVNVDKIWNIYAELYAWGFWYFLYEKRNHNQ